MKAKKLWKEFDRLMAERTRLEEYMSPEIRAQLRATEAKLSKVADALNAIGLSREEAELTWSYLSVSRRNPNGERTPLPKVKTEKQAYDYAEAHRGQYVIASCAKGDLFLKPERGFPRGFLWTPA